MKRSILYLSFSVCFLWIVLSSYSGGRAAVSGGDSTISGCSCHNGGNFSPSIAMELLDGGSPVTEYTPGSSYTFSVTVSGDGTQTGFGMQSKALAGSVQGGDFTTALTANSQISTLGSVEFPEQNGYSTSGIFQYTWVAPAASTGDVVFYSAGNAVNGVGSSGDGMTSPINMTITEAAAAVCNDPTNLTVTNIQATSADMSWTTGGATIWETALVNSGAGVPTAGVAAVTTTESISGLTPGTTYDAYVRDVCSSSLMLTAAFDGPLAGGHPKGVELYAVNDIADLSAYGLGSANNGGGTDGQEFTFPAMPLSAGTFLYVVSDSTGFTDYFGFPADFVTSSMLVNGDDAIELFVNGTVIDVFGDPNCDPNSATNGCPTNVWEYMDGWAYRNSGEVNNMGSFDTLKWTLDGPNTLDNCADNATCGSQIPIGTFITSSDVSLWVGPETFTTPCTTVTLNEVVSDISCNGSSDGSITLAPSGFGFTYQWAHGSTTAAITGLDASTYDVTISYGNCTQAESFTISEPGALSLNITSTDITCNGALDGTATAIVSGGTPPYTYMWNTGATTADISGCTPGVIYDITVSDGSGCNALSSVSVSEPLAISITASTNISVSCNGGNDGELAISISGGPASIYSYDWSNGSTTDALTGINAGVYDVTVSSGACDEVAAYTITEPNAFALSVTVVDATTSGGTDGSASAVVDVPSNYTYVWNNNGQTTQTATGYGAGIATVTVTNGGCDQISSGVVADPAACNLSVTLSGSGEVCNGASDGMLMANVIGGPSTLYSFVWSNSMTDQSISGLPANSYSVTVNSGSCVVSETTSITNINGPEAGTGGSLALCSSDAVADLFEGLSGTIDSSGTWSDVLFGSTIFPIVSGADTSDYTYTVDDGNGTSCSIDSAVVNVIVYEAPNTGGNATTSACITAASINLADELNNPDFGIWLDLDVTGALTDSIFDVSAVSQGDYLVGYAVSGNTGCDADTAFITVQIVSAPDAGTGGVLVACDDQLVLDPSTGLSGTPDANGTWTDDDGSGALLLGNFSPAAAGGGDWNLTYTVSATGCADASATVTVTVNETPNAGGNGSDTVCVTESSFDLTAVLSGTPDANGTWSDDNSSGALNGSILDPTAAGTGVYDFTYTVSADSPCVDATSVVTVTVDVCAGLSETVERRSAELFPNPSNGNFILQLEGWDQKPVSYRITALDGRQVYAGVISPENNQIEWRNAAAGVYFVTIKQNDYSTVRELIID